MKILVWLAFAFASPSLIVNTASASPPVKLTISFVKDDAYHGLIAKRFAAELREVTEGKINAKAIPYYLDIFSQLRALTKGLDEAAIVPPRYMSNVRPAFLTPEFPELFDSMEHQYRTLNHASVRSRFLSLATSENVKGMAIWSGGLGGFATRKPIKKISDLRGLRLTVSASLVELRQLQSVGVHIGNFTDQISLTSLIERKFVTDGIRGAFIVPIGPSRQYPRSLEMTYVLNGSYIPSAIWVYYPWFKKLSLRQQKILEVFSWQFSARAQQLAAARTHETYPARSFAFPVEERQRLVAKFVKLGEKNRKSNHSVSSMYNLIKAAAAYSK